MNKMIDVHITVWKFSAKGDSKLRHAPTECRQIRAGVSVTGPTLLG